MISYNEAVKSIEKEFNTIIIDIEEIPLEMASQRTLAENVYADVNLPPFDNSAVDGIAIKFNKDITKWNIIGEISAGNFSEFDFNDNSAVSIMTGSKIPEFCDTIIPVEDIILYKQSATIKDQVKIKTGMNIRGMGSDIKSGELVLPENILLKSRHLAAAASCGKSVLKVLSPLQIAVLATGDELIDVSEKPENDKIRVSNTYALCSGIKELNQSPLNLGFIKDNRELIKLRLRKVLSSDVNILITTGGVSVGKFDYVKDLFKELGVKEIFWRANIKPGKPAFFGIFEVNNKKKLIFGLPGNPVSSLVNFEIYIKPFILKMYGMGKIEKVSAFLENDLNKKDNKRHFMKAYLQEDGGGRYHVTSHISQSSGNLVELSKSNCLIEIDEKKLNPRKGETVTCIKI
ncbi:MAG: molybdopterin molybdenumtransferase MoeA [Ignavibacteriae bacterium HGW-Ignavibacteriae-2]|nr:MAG: molybdopterin molybdenumtransferase MoeA [Ignavibacteriae bacterium HGW-Ignavibacteriae-2]